MGTVHAIKRAPAQGSVHPPAVPMGQAAALTRGSYLSQLTLGQEEARKS